MAECDTERLIALVQERRPIYDISMRDHSNRAVLDRLWEEIARDLNSTVGECKVKWANLRNSLSRELRERRKPLSGPRPKKRKTWYLMEAMSFMTDFMNLHHNLCNNLQESISPDNNNEKMMDFSQNSSEPIDKESDSANEVHNTVFKKIRPKSQPTDEVPGLNNIMKARNSSREPDDPNLVFFKSLVPDMNKLTPRKQRQFKGSVLLLLNQMLDQEEDERENNTMLPHDDVTIPPTLPHPDASMDNYSVPPFLHLQDSKCGKPT